MTKPGVWFVFCRVEVWLDPGETLGISIVGGRSVIKRLKNGEELKGIFIKQVLPDSPAGRTRALKTGDKILQVSNTHTHTDSPQTSCATSKMCCWYRIMVVTVQDTQMWSCYNNIIDFTKLRHSVLFCSSGGRCRPTKRQPWGGSAGH